MNGKPVSIDSQHRQVTVDMNNKPLLDAYEFMYNDNVIYNTYNLLSGDDDWDPMSIKNIVEVAQKLTGRTLTGLPVQIIVSPAKDTIESPKGSVVLKAKLNRFGNFELKNEKVNWTIAPEYESFAKLQTNEDGSCTVTATNEGDDAKEVIIRATTASGLEGAGVVCVSPGILDAPKFSMLPGIFNKNGKLIVIYKLDESLRDQSLITWYRCSDVKGDNAVEMAVSRFNQSKHEYILTSGDVGYYIMAKVSPKNNRSLPGAPRYRHG